ncbi:choice-of-anchor G family protein [Jatrophihabitans fulvus]
MHVSVHTGATRRRRIRATAAVAVVTVGAAAIVGSGGGPAAAADLPRAQSVGRFLDGAVGGNAVQRLADLKDARAEAAPNSQQRNPLEAELLNTIDVPLGNALKLPGGGALNLGAANQIAVANTNGSSYGASGAVLNTGGVSLNDNQKQFPANATVNLTADALGSAKIPGLPAVPGLPTSGIPGAGNFAALGGLKAQLGAVAALVQTGQGGKVTAVRTGITDVTLSLGSPALGALLQQLAGLLGTGPLGGALPDLGPLATLIKALPASDRVNLSTCRLTNPGIKKSLSLAGGGVTVNTAAATVSIDLNKLVKRFLGKDISNLSTSNFDLIDFLVTNLPRILSSGLTDLVTGITTPLTNEFKGCLKTLDSVPLIGGITSTIVDPLVTALENGQKTLVGAIKGLSTQFSTASAGPLGQLADVLKNVVDIGLNVQSGPGIQPRDRQYPFESNLRATPAQNTAVVDGQTLARAIEIQLLDTSSLPVGSLPAGGLGQLPGLNRVAAAAPTNGVATLALANAAAGPSTAAPAPPTSSAPPTTSVPPATNTNIPTGIPAGAAGEQGEGGMPVLPLVAIIALLSVAGAAFWQYRATTGGLHRH